MKLTKSNIEQIAIPKTGYKIYRDEKLTGFCVRVRNTGTKTFIIDRKINNKLYRYNIGRFGELTVEQARTQAQKLLGQLCIGINPKKEIKNDEKSPALIKVFEDYLAARKSLRPRTIDYYQRLMWGKFSDWHSIPLVNITKEMITKRHATIGKTSPISANNAMKLISALFNFAMYEYDDNRGNSTITQNPVMKLSKTRAWYPCKRRRTKIETHQLPAWFKAVNNLRDYSPRSLASTIKDYLILLLFTGLRREEPLPLIWSDKKSADPKIAEKQSVVDLEAKTLLIRDTKNGQDHCLPLSDYLMSMLTNRKKSSESIYVFPNKSGNCPFCEPKRQIKKSPKHQE